MRVNSARLAAVLLAPALVLLTPALAMADDGPGAESGNNSQDVRSPSDRDGDYYGHDGHDGDSEDSDSDGSVDRTSDRETRGHVTRNVFRGGLVCFGDGDGDGDGDGHSHGHGHGHGLLNITLGDISLFNTDVGDDDNDDGFRR